MRVKADKTSLLASLLIFTLIVIIGLAAGVTFYVTLLRGAGAALVIGLLVYYFVRYINKQLIPAFAKKAREATAEMKKQLAQQAMEKAEALKGSQIDFTAGQDEDISTLLSNTATNDTSDHGEDNNSDQFQPFMPQQIDPNLEKILKENPQQAAEVVRKMGFDQ